MSALTCPRLSLSLTCQVLLLFLLTDEHHLCSGETITSHLQSVKQFFSLDVSQQSLTSRSLHYWLMKLINASACRVNKSHHRSEPHKDFWTTSIKTELLNLWCKLLKLLPNQMRKETQHSADIKVFLFFFGVKLWQYVQNHYTDLGAKYHPQQLQMHTRAYSVSPGRKGKIRQPFHKRLRGLWFAKAHIIVQNWIKMYFSV